MQQSSRVVGYVRVSTEEQAVDGVSLEAQRAKLIAYAHLYDLEIVEIVEDAGRSAKSLNRPGMQRALATLASGVAEGLLIAKLDRLSRSVRDWNLLIERYFGERAGNQLFSVNDSIDTRTAAGRLVLNVLMSVSQWEREECGERTRTALAYKRTRGQKLGGRVPFGYRAIMDCSAGISHGRRDHGPRLIEDAAEQKTLSEMRRLRMDGHSFRAIAQELNRRMIAAKEGGAWQHTAVRGILNRSVATCQNNR